MTIRVAPRAALDLAEIREYLDDAGSPHGAAVVQRLVAGVRKLATMAHRGRPVRLSTGREIRRILIGKYLVLYEIAGDHVNILRIVHAHRDLRDIFGPDEVG